VEDYSGSWAARLLPGRLILSFGAVLTSFGVGAFSVANFAPTLPYL
jgi:hypothetical protein